MRIKKGDQIQIISGKDRGKRGKVLRVIIGDNKIVAEKLNIMKKHVRPRKEGEKGQRVEIPAAIDVSNAMLVCPNCGKLTRIKYKTEGTKKIRVCKKCNKDLK